MRKAGCLAFYPRGSFRSRKVAALLELHKVPSHIAASLIRSARLRSAIGALLSGVLTRSTLDREPGPVAEGAWVGTARVVGRVGYEAMRPSGLTVHGLAFIRTG